MLLLSQNQWTTYLSTGKKSRSTRIIWVFSVPVFFQKATVFQRIESMGYWWKRRDSFATLWNARQRSDLGKRRSDLLNTPLQLMKKDD